MRQKIGYFDLQPKKIRASDGMATILSHELDAFAGNRIDYGSLGLVRCLGHVCNAVLVDDKTEWLWLRDSSPNLKRIKKLGIYDFADAEQCRSCIQSALQLSRYSLSDLVVYVCLLDKGNFN